MVAVSVQLYGCTTCILTKRSEKKFDWNYTRILLVVLKKSWKQQLYSNLPPISNTIQVRQARYPGLNHNQHSPMDFYTWTHVLGDQQKLTSSALYWQWILSRRWSVGMNNGRESKESMLLACIVDDEDESKRIDAIIGLILWHINYCGLFNAESIFIHINSSIANNSV